MTDSISRQAAIDVLHGYFDGMLETDTWSPCDVYGLIETLPSADVPHWIPCSERMPKTPIRVQVQLDNSWIITAYYDEGKWYAVPDMYWGEPLEGVLAWMPLPEPWRGEQNE